ncbi:MAG: AAA family ATPase [Candidatus Caldarchaeum sp.]
MWINRLDVENFRGIGKIKLETKPINVFVGRNNTGKSSVLEAATIAATSPTGYADALNNDLLLPILGKETSLSYWVKMGYKEARIKLESKDSTIRELVINYFEKGLPETDSEQARKLIAQQSFRELTPHYSDKNELAIMMKRKLDELTALPKLCLMDVSSENMVIVVQELERLSIIRMDTPAPSNVFYVGNVHKPSLTMLYNKLVQSGLIQNIMKMLSEQISYLTDLRTVGDKLFVFLDGLDKPLPVSLMGDGFQALLRSAFAAALAKDGLLVLEEPEVNLHPGFVELITSHLAEYTKKYQMQVFLSTHSLEFLESLLEKAMDITQVVRMYLVGGEIDYEVLSGEEASAEVKQLEMDLRGA